MRWRYSRITARLTVAGDTPKGLAPRRWQTPLATISMTVASCSPDNRRGALSFLPSAFAFSKPALVRRRMETSSWSDTQAAKPAFEANIEHGWASCPLTQNGYFRIVSQARYPRPRPLAEAYEQLSAATSTRHHLFILDDVSLLDDTLVDFRLLSGPRQLTDVYLLALAVVHDRPTGNARHSHSPQRRPPGQGKQHSCTLISVTFASPTPTAQQAPRTAPSSTGPRGSTGRTGCFGNLLGLRGRLRLALCMKSVLGSGP